ncbi:hypothetical protein P7K49_025280 [Saguinus oedipus]|uniref:Uncharacterized protein n=1 Tax=Saguinus oedipus TaxID=9490 RepID=A0ABQ9UH83_SAGOE|nr:hypothetical protein P7K49_025280 [Saguinus oedipus]
MDCAFPEVDPGKKSDLSNPIHNPASPSNPKNQFAQILEFLPSVLSSTDLALQAICCTVKSASLWLYVLLCLPQLSTLPTEYTGILEKEALRRASLLLRQMPRVYKGSRALPGLVRLEKKESGNFVQLSQYKAVLQESLEYAKDSTATIVCVIITFSLTSLSHYDKLWAQLCWHTQKLGPNPSRRLTQGRWVRKSSLSFWHIPPLWGNLQTPKTAGSLSLY